MLQVESVHLQRSVKRVAEARNCGLYVTVGILYNQLTGLSGRD